MSETKRRYAEVVERTLGGSETVRRVLVVEYGEELGHTMWATGDCTGCTEIGDYGAQWGPDGCSECGYTGKRRSPYFLPFWCYDRWRYCGKNEPWQKTPAPGEAVAA